MEHDAKVTALVCFSSPAGSNPAVRVCLGVSPPPGDPEAAKVPREWKFTVDLVNVAVSLPNPPGGQPVMGVVSISQSLPLSLQDMKAMQAWLTHALSHQ